MLRETVRSKSGKKVRSDASLVMRNEIAKCQLLEARWSDKHI